MTNVLSFFAATLLFPAPIAAAETASASPGLDGVWLIEAPQDYPGLRAIRIDDNGGRPSGDLFTDWYGRVPMRALRVTGSDATFQIETPSPQGAPTDWTLRLRDGAIRVAGKVWYQQVEATGHRGDATALARFMLPPNPLPSLHKLPDNGLARTPPMGWSSWNHFADKIDDATIRGIADAMVSSGLRDAGYRYVNIDDGWQGERDDAGVLHANAHFPDMKALADYVHSRGLKLGIYSSPGPKTCAGYTGSYGHVAQDAKTFAAWGIDYIKYDLCSGEGIFRTAGEVKAAYQEMGAALQASGRAIVFSLCQYGRDNVGRWGRDVGGNLWRTSGDIEDTYESMAKIGFATGGEADDAGPGGWNDLDMLEVGNGGMSIEEYRTHLSLWAMQAAPLILGNDLRAMTAETRALLTKAAVIAVDQDPLGKAGHRVQVAGSTEIWTRPLAKGGEAVAYFNRSDRPMSVKLAAPAGSQASAAVDLWTGKVVRFGGKAVIPAHGVILLRVSRKP
ncbi:MAG: glycoside hydrolase family 27 protein [Sphingomonas sp.]